MNIRRCAHCRNVEDSVTHANHQTLMHDKTDDLGLWIYMKENKRFWLLPIMIVVLFISTLAVWGQQSLAPSMMLNTSEGYPIVPF